MRREGIRIVVGIVLLLGLGACQGGKEGAIKQLNERIGLWQPLSKQVYALADSLTSTRSIAHVTTKTIIDENYYWVPMSEKGKRVMDSILRTSQDQEVMAQKLITRFDTLKLACERSETSLELLMRQVHSGDLEPSLATQKSDSIENLRQKWEQALPTYRQDVQRLNKRVSYHRTVYKVELARQLKDSGVNPPQD